MKKTILLSSIFAVGAALAVEVTSAELGVMGLAKPTTAAGLIAVPFIGNGGDIKVADMINTAELEKGAELYVPVAGEIGTYEIWTLNAERKWTKADKIVEIGKDGVSKEEGASPSANETTIEQGGSFWLKLPTEATTGKFYLLGQMGGDGTSTAVGGKWNLIGNTSGCEVNLSGLVGTSYVDQIVVPLADGRLRYYIYKDSKGWLYQKEDGLPSDPTKEEEQLKVAVGQGIWYRPNVDRTIDWSTGKLKEKTAQ